MAGDTRTRAGPDRGRINLSQDHELQYWTKTLGVSAKQLREALDEVGSSVERVRQYLARARADSR